MRNAFEHLVLVGAAADVEEVGGLAAVVLDQVHRAHRQPRAVDQAGDVAVEADVAQARSCAARSSAGSSSATSSMAAMSGWRNRALSSKLSLQSSARTSPVVGDDQRVDLGERGVLVEEELDEALEERPRPSWRSRPVRPERLADLAGLEVGQAERRRRSARGGSSRASRGRRSRSRRPPRSRPSAPGTCRPRSIGQAEVELAGDVVADGDQHLGDRLALGAGLVGDQGLAQQARGGLLGLVAADRTSWTPLAIPSGRGFWPLAISRASRAVDLGADGDPLAAAARRGPGP